TRSNRSGGWGAGGHGATSSPHQRGVELVRRSLLGRRRLPATATSHAHSICRRPVRDRVAPSRESYGTDGGREATIDAQRARRERSAGREVEPGGPARRTPKRL